MCPVSRRMGLLHAWTNQLQQLLPGARITWVRVEATFADGKRRGWDLERTHVRDQARLDVLLLVWHLAL